LTRAPSSPRKVGVQESLTMA